MIRVKRSTTYFCDTREEALNMIGIDIECGEIYFNGKTDLRHKENGGSTWYEFEDLSIDNCTIERVYFYHEKEIPHMIKVNREDEK